MATVAYYYSSVSVPDTVGNSGGLSATATSVIAGSLAPDGYPSQYPFKLRLEPGTPSEELVKIIAGSGTPVDPWITGQSVAGGASTLGRGWDGTLAAPHNQGAALQHGMSAEDLQLSRVHESLDNTTVDNLGSPVLPHSLPLSAWGSQPLALLQATVLPNAKSSVVWNNIPQTYSHLLVVVLGKTAATGNRDDTVNMTFNGDTSARYSFTAAFWTDNTPGGGGSVADSQNSVPPLVVATSASGTANAGGGFAFLPGYSGTTFNKAVFGVSGMGQGTSQANASLRLRSCFWNPASQVGINSIAMVAGSGSQFKAGSMFSLYGLA